MKHLIRIIAVVFAISALSCLFVACDNADKDSDIDLPERELYEVTVSFQIKDSTGKTVIEAIDYTYKGHTEPTILTVVDNYLSVVADWTCKIDKNNTITQIGGMKAGKGDYWGFATNVIVDEDDKTVSLKESSAINLSMEQINKYKSDGKMSETPVIDGAEFTIILFVSEDD